MVPVTACYLGRHSDANDKDREVYLLTLDSLSTPYLAPEIAGHQFTCLCALDATFVSSEDLSRFCLRLLELGCAYFCAWGPDCERVHDTMDKEEVGLLGSPDGGVVMTTWHAKDSLKAALDFFIDCTEPDETYAPHGCDRGLIICVANPKWKAAIKRYASREIGFASR